MSPSEFNSALIVGCGDLGVRVARQLHDSGFQVTGIRRSAATLPTFIKPMQLDIRRSDLSEVIGQQGWGVVIITLTARGEDAYRAVYVDGVDRVLRALQQSGSRPLVLFASSTSVYAQNDGSIVDESSETRPDGYSGKMMLAAEHLVAQSGFPYCAIRYSGIYGAGRGGHLLEVLKQGRICPAWPIRYSNRIHVGDCVNILIYLVSQYKGGQLEQGIYLGTDCHSVPLRNVMEWFASCNDIELSTLEENYVPGRGGNKRCYSQRLIDQGFEFQYTDFKQGYLVD